MLVATRYEILRDVQANGRVSIPLAEKPVRVATMLDEKQFNHLAGAMSHQTTVFLEDQHHDWQWDEGQFRYYTRVAQRADVLIAYEVQEVSKFDVEAWVLAFKEAHELHSSRKPAMRRVLREIFVAAISRAQEVTDAQERVGAVKVFLANLRDHTTQTLKASDWRLEVYRWIAWHKGFAHLVAWQSPDSNR